MRLIKPSIEILEQGSGIQGIYKQGVHAISQRI